MGMQRKFTVNVCVSVFVLQKFMTAVIGRLKANLEGILGKQRQLA